MLRPVLVMAAVLGIPPLACSRPHAAPEEAAPTASATAEDVPAAVPPPSAPLPIPSTRVFPGAPPGFGGPPKPEPGARVAGNNCTPGQDSIACTPDGLEALTCAGGQWRMLQSCHGPAHCAGIGSSLTCDTGMPQPGDPCARATAETRCRSAREAIVCQGGSWMVSPCRAGTLCTPGGGKGQAGCK